MFSPRPPFACFLLVAMLSVLPLGELSELGAAEAPPAGGGTAGPTPSPLQRIENGSPERLPDGRVVFRYLSGAAKSVQVRGQFGAEVQLVRGENDLWAGTTAAPVPAGVHEYNMLVDGVVLPDPLNRMLKPQRWPNTSILHVPAQPPAPWDNRQVPHGTVHRHSYWSESLGTWRSLVVATPPGVKTGTALGAALPVLYLSHGFSDTEETWTVHGRAHVILESLLADGKAVPMILVMPDAHALPPPSGWADHYGAENSEAFAREMIAEVIPFVEAHYPADPNPSARAFAGLSMGGRHAIVMAFRHAEVFSQIGAFSAAAPDQATLDAALADVPGLNSRLRRFWIACGEKDFLHKQNDALHATLEKAGVRHDYLRTEGDHSWPVWRRYLVDFLPLLFRPDGH